MANRESTLCEEPNDLSYSYEDAASGSKDHIARECEKYSENELTDKADTTSEDDCASESEVVECDDGESVKSKAACNSCGLGMICRRLLGCSWKETGGKVKWKFDLDVKLNASNQHERGKKAAQTARRRKNRHSSSGEKHTVGSEMNGVKLKELMQENKMLKQKMKDYLMLAEKLKTASSRNDRLKEELLEARDQCAELRSLNNKHSEQHTEETNRLQLELERALSVATMMEDKDKTAAEALCCLNKELESSLKQHDSIVKELAIKEETHRCAVDRLTASLQTAANEKVKIVQEYQTKVDELRMATELRSDAELKYAKLDRKFHDIMVQKNLLEQFIDKNILRTNVTLDVNGTMYSCAICKERFTNFAHWHTHWTRCYMRKPTISNPSSEKL